MCPHLFQVLFSSISTYISLSFGTMQPYGTLAALTAVFFHGTSNSDGALTERALEIRSGPCSRIKTGEGKKKKYKNNNNNNNNNNNEKLKKKTEKKLGGRLNAMGLCCRRRKEAKSTWLTFCALAVRVEVGDDRSGGVFQTQEPRPDQSFALG